MERWSTRHQWRSRVATWDLGEQDLRREARAQAVSDAEERHGKLARALLGRVAAELGAHHKGQCETCGRAPPKLNGIQVATWMKAGVEVERLALGLGTAGASVISQHNTTNIQVGSTTAVLLRDPKAQQLASELFARMRALDPAMAQRRLTDGGNGVAAAAKAMARAEVEAEADHAGRLELEADSGSDRTAAEELGQGDDEDDLF